jgi:negative regulator of flagellin synthesis FlgM
MSSAGTAAALQELSANGSIPSVPNGQFYGGQKLSSISHRGLQMSGINGIGNTNPVQRIVNQPILRQTAAEPITGRLADRLEVSGLSHLLKSLKADGIRTDKVASIKAEIEAGKYETDQKLDVAVDRLLDELHA